MDSLKALLTEMREADSLCARYADAIQAALADTGTLTDAEISDEAYRRYPFGHWSVDNLPKHDTFIEGAKWARDYRTPSVPTLDDVVHAVYTKLREAYPWPDVISRVDMSNQVAAAVLALYPNTKETDR